MKKIFVLAMISVFLFASSPAYVEAASLHHHTQAQSDEDTAASACAQAQADASADTNRLLWGAIGCVGSLIGVLIAYVVSPSVPPQRLMGKSSDYVMQYTGCYQDKGKGEQGMAAIWGCLISAVITIIYEVIIWVWYTNTVNSITSGV